MSYLLKSTLPDRPVSRLRDRVSADMPIKIVIALQGRGVSR